MRSPTQTTNVPVVLRVNSTIGIRPAARLWHVVEPTDPPIPQWISDMWAGAGNPGVQGSEQVASTPHGRALLWFVNNWYSLRRAYRFTLPRKLVAWLNTTSVDLSKGIQVRPALGGFTRCTAPKPLSRVMNLAWENDGRSPSLDSAERYYDFLGEFVFALLPGLNAPQALLPSGIVDLLNAPAGESGLPLTVGMLLYIKRTCPGLYPQLRELSREKLLALSFHALDGLLALNDPRLIPESVSGFWSQRPLPAGIVTAFEYVSAAFQDGSIASDLDSSSPDDEKEIRIWFHNAAASVNRTLLLFSGPSGDATSVAIPPEQIDDEAVIAYRDHVTVAGLSRAGASMVSALQSCGLPIFDLHFSLGRDRLEIECERNRNVWINARRKLHLLNLNPEYVPECCYCNLGRIGPRDYVVGHFFWELSRVSRLHEPGIAMVDEIWTASHYLARLYASATDKPVITMGLAISARRVAPLNPEQFGFSSSTYIFLSSFDAGSIVERKNPLGTIAAFQQAFPRGNEKVGLVIKTRNLENLQTAKDRIHWQSAMERVRGDLRIRIVQHTMTDEELAGLYEMCDCFVSLHRSEGFGLGPAEAMAHGKPVIVTNYSGVCDFCTPETAKLVNYETIRLQADEYPFLDHDREYHWADPDLKAAAECMGQLAFDPGEGERLGLAGRQLILREYSPEALGRRCASRLEQLGFRPGSQLSAGDSPHRC